MGVIPRLNLPGGRGSGTPGGDTAAAAVAMGALSVSFDDTVALRDVSLNFDAGELVAVIGPNGSGKSTMLSAIAGLVAPASGTVLVHGQPPAQAHARIAYVMQTLHSNQAVPLTVRETVRMGRYAHAGAFRPLTQVDRGIVDEAMERMHITDLADRQLHELSGGQRQRAYVAQGLAQRADVLLLDEPVTGLDLVTQDVIMGVIRQERANGTTVVLTTHDVGTARTADHVVLLATRVVAGGPATEVLTPALLSEAYGGHLHLLDDGTVVLDDPHHHGAPGQLDP